MLTRKKKKKQFNFYNIYFAYLTLSPKEEKIIKLQSFSHAKLLVCLNKVSPCLSQTGRSFKYIDIFN